MSLRALEGMAWEEEHRLRDRYTIGHCNGLKAAVIAVRLGDLEDIIETASQSARVRNMQDPYDVGFVAALREARDLMQRGGG